MTGSSCQPCDSSYSGVVDPVTEAENKLYSGCFKEAVHDALQVLEGGEGLPSSSDADKTRCMYVLLQAHFMTRDFDALDQLMNNFKDVKRRSPSVVVLWVLILLDFQQNERAKVEVKEFLAGLQPLEGAALKPTAVPDINILALARLYAVELLAKTEAEFIDAHTWLVGEGTKFLPMAAVEMLVREVDQAASSKGECGVAAQHVIAAGGSCTSAYCTMTGSMPETQGHADYSSRVRYGVDVVKPTWLQALGSWGQNAWPNQYLSSTCQKLEQLNLTPIQAMVAATVGGVLLYALYTERKPLSRWIRQQASRLSVSASDLSALAFAVSPSPLGPAR